MPPEFHVGQWRYENQLLCHSAPPPNLPFMYAPQWNYCCPIHRCSAIVLVVVEVCVRVCGKKNKLIYLFKLSSFCRILSTLGQIYHYHLGMYKKKPFQLWVMTVPHNPLTFPCLPLGNWLKPKPCRLVLLRWKQGQGGPPHPAFSQLADHSCGTRHKNGGFLGSVLSCLPGPIRVTVSTTSTWWDATRVSHRVLWSRPSCRLASLSYSACVFSFTSCTSFHFHMGSRPLTTMEAVKEDCLSRYSLTFTF